MKEVCDGMEATRVRSKQLKYDGNEIPKSMCASLAKEHVSTVQADHAVGGFARNLVIATLRMGFERLECAIICSNRAGKDEADTAGRHADKDEPMGCTIQDRGKRRG